SHTSSIGLSRSWAAKNCSRYPANQVASESGVPCRYVLMLFWNVLWSTVLILILTLVDFVASAVSAANAWLVASWEQFDPKVIPFAEPPDEPEFLSLLHAASRAPGTVAAAASPARPLRVVRRLTWGMPELSGIYSLLGARGQRFQAHQYAPNPTSSNAD